MNSRTTENYLKAVYRHSRDNPDQGVSLGIIADDLGVTPGTVTQMMKHLAGRGLVTYRSRQGASLTKLGEKTALGIIRRHRLIELFLVEVMGFDWADVHDEAEELEHVVSDRLVERMDEMLGRPVRDPHGAPIPSARGTMKPGRARSLSDCEAGTYCLMQVAVESADFLGWLSECALLPGTVFELVRSDPIAGTLSLELPGNRSLSIGTDAACNLLVSEAGIEP
mgnify:CR=1 FL=1